jgi:hypothetical protein
VKKAKQIQACREWMPVPCPGSMTHAVDAAFWDRIAAQTCGHCKCPIGYGVGIYLYQPRQEAAHIRCTDEAEEAGIALRSSAFMVDAAAKLAGLTQEQFRQLAVWEKDRLIAEVNATRQVSTRSGYNLDA